MPAPLVVGAAAVAARLLARKLAKDAAKKTIKQAVKTAKKSKPLAEPKSAVKVKPPAKTKPGKPNEAKAMYKFDDFRGRVYNKSVKEYESSPSAGRFGSAAERDAMANEAIASSPLGRKVSIVGRKLVEAERRKATTPKRTPAKPAQNTVKINSAPKKAKAKTKSDARGLKAANKPLSKGNQKLVTNIKRQTGYIAMDRRPTPPTVAAALKKGPKGAFIAEAKKIAMQEARSEGPAKKISPAQKALNKKKK